MQRRQKNISRLLTDDLPGQQGTQEQEEPISSA
jgi:hypothetical protein